MELLDEAPRMIIGKNVLIRGDMKYEGLLKVEGSVDGQLIAPFDARLIISSHATYVGDIKGISVAIIDGTVKGEVQVAKLFLGSNAIIHGDVKCQSLSIAGGAELIGQLSVDPKNIIESTYEPTLSEDTDDESEDDQEVVLPTIPEPPKIPHEVRLLILEPQTDFFDSRNSNDLDNSAVGESYGYHKAEADVMQRIVDFIHLRGMEIDHIGVTLDSHNRMDLCHGLFWKDENGREPAVGTDITLDDVQIGRWVPKNEQLLSYCEEQLRDRGSIRVCAEHCLIGSQGAAVVPMLSNALSSWMEKRSRNIDFISAKSERVHPERLAKRAVAVGECETEGEEESSLFSPLRGSPGSRFGAAASGLNDGASVVSITHTSRYDIGPFLGEMGDNDCLLVAGHAHAACLPFSIVEVSREFAEWSASSGADDRIEDSKIEEDGANRVGHRVGSNGRRRLILVADMLAVGDRARRKGSQTGAAAEGKGDDVVDAWRSLLDGDMSDASASSAAGALSAAGSARNRQLIQLLRESKAMGAKVMTSSFATLLAEL